MGERLCFHNAKVITPHAVLDGGAVLCENGRITAVGDALRPTDGANVDCQGDVLAPGSIDLHIHGAAGAMVEQATPEAMATVARALPRYGTTGFLATFATSPLDTIRQGFAAIREVGEVADGARILGVHLEGPYLNPLRAGAQPPPWMRTPDPREVRALLDEADGLVRLVTLAPELPHAEAVIRLLTDRGIIVSAGHTDATAHQIAAGIEAGVSHATHLFNAMRGMHHREPGAAGALLADDRVTCELICDGHHVLPDMLRLAFRTKPLDRLVLITDAVAPMGLGEGEYDLFGVRCIVRGGAVRLDEAGNLAGSVLSLDMALRNLATWFPELDLPRLWRYAAYNPAQELGLRAYGRIEPGAAADLVRYGNGFGVRETYRGGVCVYRAGEDDG